LRIHNQFGLVFSQPASIPTDNNDADDLAKLSEALDLRTFLES
jgi:hypothetical protein